MKFPNILEKINDTKLLNFLSFQAKKKSHLQNKFNLRRCFCCRRLSLSLSFLISYMKNSWNVGWVKCRSIRLEVFCKKGVLRACNFIKKGSLAQVFFCEFCEISKNTFFYKTLPVAASVKDSNYLHLNLTWKFAYVNCGRWQLIRKRSKSKIFICFKLFLPQNIFKKTTTLSTWWFWNVTL